MPRGIQRHGTAYGYVRNGCRCQLCTDTYKEKSREWRQNAKERKQGAPPKKAPPRHMYLNPETGEMECLMCVDIDHLLRAGETTARIGQRLGIVLIDSLYKHAQRHDESLYTRLVRRTEEGI